MHKITTILLLILSTFSCIAKDKNNYIYSGEPQVWIDEDNILKFQIDSKVEFVLNEKLVVTSGNNEEYYSTCPKNTEWSCVQSVSFNLSIKDSWRSFPKQWKYNDYEYYLLSNEKLNWLGKDVETHVLLSKNKISNENINIIFYSWKYGVVKFTTFDNKTFSSNVYLLEGTSGFLKIDK